MAIDIDAESGDLLTLADAAKLLPVFNGKRTHVSTLWRWCFKGSQGVQLEYTRLGSRILTTQAALYRFMQARTEADRQPRAEPRRRTPAQRQRAVDDACDELKKRGAMDAIPA